MKRILPFFLIFPFTFCQSQNNSPLWSDDFNGTSIDTTIWEFELGNACERPCGCGWGNNELEYYTARTENARISEGSLILEARKENYKNHQYTSARIKTKTAFQFGKIEASIKLPIGQGIWPAFWMLPADSGSIWPKDGEIDILEYLGHDPSKIYGTSHFGPSWQDHHSNTGTFTLPSGSFSDDFHTFAIKWKKNKITWLVDGAKYFSQKPSNLSPYTWPFNDEFYIILNLAVGGNWPGNPDDKTTFPQKMEIDWVRVWGQ